MSRVSHCCVGEEAHNHHPRIKKVMWSSHLPQIKSERGGQPLDDNHIPRKMSHIFNNKLCNKVNKHFPYKFQKAQT